MRALADSGSPRAAELRQQADLLNEAITVACGEHGTNADVRRMLGQWARARRLWCEITGEDLV
jgi:hypothetical protein